MCVEREQFCGLAKLPQIRHINYAQLLLEQSIYAETSQRRFRVCVVVFARNGSEVWQKLNEAYISLYSGSESLQR